MLLLMNERKLCSPRAAYQRRTSWRRFSREQRSDRERGGRVCHTGPLKNAVLVGRLRPLKGQKKGLMNQGHNNGAMMHGRKKVRKNENKRSQTQTWIMN